MSGPFDHQWLGGLLGDAEAAAIWSADRQLAHMLRFEAALARALGASGAVDPAAGERTARAIEAAEIAPESLRAGTARDGVPVPALVRHLRALPDADPGAVHAGATSQDVIDSALALTLREATDLSLRRLDALDAALAALGNRHGAARIMGRTRMQAAMPIKASIRIEAWRRPLARHRDRLVAARPRIERLQLGGAAGDRAGLGPRGASVSAHVAAELDLADEAVWHAERDGVAEHGACMALIAGTLGKLGQDVCLMAQQGVDEIVMSGGGGSSAMAHKSNPIGAELLVTLARYAAGQAGSLAQAMVHEQERSGAAWTLEWMVLPDLSRAALRSLACAADVAARVRRIGPASPDAETGARPEHPKP